MEFPVVMFLWKFYFWHKNKLIEQKILKESYLHLKGGRCDVMPDNSRISGKVLQTGQFWLMHQTVELSAMCVRT